MKNVSLERLKEALERVYGNEADVAIIDEDVWFYGELVQPGNLEYYGLKLSDGKPQASDDELDTIIEDMGPELTNPL